MQQGARAIILKDEKILLGKRLKKDSFYRQWCSFGGLSEAGETPEETLKRELCEELGITVLNPRFIAIVEYRVPTTREKIQQYFYIIQDWKGEVTNKSEHMEIKWFSLDELKNLRLGKAVRKVIETNFKDFLPCNPFSQQSEEKNS